MTGESVPRPLLRGASHAFAAVAAVGGIVLLVLLADSAGAYVGGAVFATSLALLYTTSAAYHRITWKPRLRSLMKRLDHAMISVLLYLAVGWLALVATTELLAWFTAVPLLLLALGGVAYTLGGVVYAAGRPNPFPRVFGYHEVFHALVIAGSSLHFALVALYVVPA